MKHRHLVLLGGGHTHALLLRWLAKRPYPDAAVTLISEGPTTPYSGMLPGVIAGHYAPEDMLIDLETLCLHAGVRFVSGRVTGLQPTEQCVRLADGTTVNYDVLSINTGATPSVQIAGAADHAIGVKPIRGLYAHWQRLLAEPTQQTKPAQWAIVGAGAGGVELVFAMAHRLRQKPFSDSPIQWHLVHSGNSVLPGYPSHVQRYVTHALHEAKIHTHPNFRVQRIDTEQLVATDGRVLKAHKTLLCTPACAPAWPQAAGLATTDSGFIAVNDFLQSTSHPNVFAAGDVAEQINDPRPKAGVFAVRQARYLHDNLARFLAHEPLVPAHLQRAFLSILALGGKTAIARRGPFAVRGAWVWRWKDRIDRRFMDLFPRVIAEPDDNR